MAQTELDPNVPIIIVTTDSTTNEVIAQDEIIADENVPPAVIAQLIDILTK